MFKITKKGQVLNVIISKKMLMEWIENQISNGELGFTVEYQNPEKYFERERKCLTCGKAISVEERDDKRFCKNTKCYRKHYYKNVLKKRLKNKKYHGDERK